MSGLQALVDTVVGQTTGLPGPEQLASWDPDLSGDIDICIRRDGSWEHEGGPIAREELVRLFASLLRREADGEYYLVTPVEKWRIRVERHPLLVIDCEREGTSQAWYALLNTGGHCRIGGANRLHGSGDHGEPFMTVPSGLTAQFTRPAWYRLVAEAQPADGNLVLDSGGESIVLGAI